MHGGTLELACGGANRRAVLDPVGLCCAFGLALVALAAPAAADAPRPNRILIEYVPPKNPDHQKIYEALKGHEVLEKLQQIFKPSYLPMIYDKGEESIQPDLKAFMFLAEWLEDYHEFHFSDLYDGKSRIRVWDSEDNHLFLSKLQAQELYRQASRILTCYYNVETYEQIFPWHHAAGDFVVKIEKENLDVKLISARQYDAVFNYLDNNTDMKYM